jgi:hypothetical protein
MNRLLVALLALSLSMVALPACDGEEPEADDEATEEEAADEEEETAEEAQAQETGEAGDLVTEFADVFTSIIGVVGEASDYQCECAPEMMGFESTEECKEATADDGEGQEEFRQCVVDAMAGVEGEPPASAQDDLDCARNAVSEVEGCFESFRADHDDLCTEEAAMAFASCGEQMETAFEACEDASDEEDDEWMAAVDDELDSCMAVAMGF